MTNGIALKNAIYI